MDDKQSGNGQGGERPDVLENISTTQLEELERQFDEGDQEAWKALTQSYGWSSEQGQELWGWFGQRSGESGQG
ncbi:MAG: hypothetical protein ABIO92_10310 [Chloroflexia bacterium]